MEKAAGLDLDRVRERLSPIVTFRTHVAWWLEAITSGEVVHSKKRTQIIANSIKSYSTVATLFAWADRLIFRQSRYACFMFIEVRLVVGAMLLVECPGLL